MSNQNQRKIAHPHFENLDALRFLAAASVFIFHWFREVLASHPQLETSFFFRILLKITNKGSLGVNFFFVLSGFLITFLILHEIKTKGRFHYGHFLIRRTLRIWPLYFLIVFIGFVAFPYFLSNFHTTHHSINYLFFLANFDEIKYGLTDSVNFLTSPWSVAVEEQFYLFWGLAFALFSPFFIKKNQSGLIVFILILLGISLVFRWMHHSDSRILYYHTLSVMPDILIGALLAIFHFNQAKWILRLQSINKKWIIAITLIGFSIIILKNQIFIGPLVVMERYVLALFFAFIILNQISFKHSVFKVGKWRFLNQGGQISYGLYMYHLVVMYLINQTINWSFSPWIQLLVYGMLSGISTFILAWVSYRLIEKPFLTLKSRFKS